MRTVDGLCESRSWSDVLHLRNLCREATLTGRQVWPIATLCEYRLALHAPADWACRVVDDRASRFSIGPLTEVVSQNHSWSDLREALSSGPHRGIVAYERAIRLDDIDDDDDVSAVLDIPIRLSDWEPEYPVAEYSDDGISAPSPQDRWIHKWTEVSGQSSSVLEVDDDDTAAALRDLVEPWTAASTGQAGCHVVEGGLEALVSALRRPAVPVAPLTSQEALQWLTWCGASSGSHGRRRGAALGRFGTWWTLAGLAGIQPEWDELRARGALADEIGRSAERLRWYRVDLGSRHSYELSLAAVDEDDDLTFGLFAYDDPV